MCGRWDFGNFLIMLSAQEGFTLHNDIYEVEQLVKVGMRQGLCGHASLIPPAPSLRSLNGTFVWKRVTTII